MTLVAKPERDIAQSTDISLLNVCKFNNIVDRGTRKNDKKHLTIEGLQTILHSTVQKILRTCTGKQTIEGVPV